MNNIPFPPEIEELILKRQVEASNKADITVYYRIQQADKDDGGFSWSSTKEGHAFWSRIFNERNYKPFYDKYPQTIKYINGTSSTPIQEYKGCIAGYPKEIVDLALERLTNIQEGKTKLESLEIKGIGSAFSWSNTPEGGKFWIDIESKNFETFYKLYPKDTQTLTNNEERSKDEQITTVDREQGIKGSSYYRASNQSRKTTTSSGYRGNIVQNRVIANRYAKCEISIDIE